jgi:UDP-N-acetylmuramyl pentapeptide phosphotransferase/UDP-N-acetylglucosamine-1-phosphate transferase
MTLELPILLVAFVAAALLSAAIIAAIRPLLLRYALARPNARSSHRVPTPQGAGIAVIAATLLVACAVMVGTGAADLKIPFAVFAATLFIAIVGLADDIKSIEVLPRLLLQGTAVAAVIFAASGDLRIVPACPLWIERAVLLLAGLWFVNLVNFMDGLDWMTVAEIVPVTAAMIMLGALGEFPVSATLIAAALCSDLRRSTGRWPRFFSATSAACRSACCSAGACCSSPGISNSPPRCCCRSITCSTRR